MFSIFPVQQKIRALTLTISKYDWDTINPFFLLHLDDTFIARGGLKTNTRASKLRELKETLKRERSAAEADLSVFSEYLAGINALEKGDYNMLNKELSKLVAKEEEINRLKMDAFYVEIIDQCINTPLDPRFKETVLGVLSETEKTTNLVVNTIFRPHHQT
jgi:hypothetical protein